MDNSEDLLRKSMELNQARRSLDMARKAQEAQGALMGGGVPAQIPSPTRQIKAASAGGAGAPWMASANAASHNNHPAAAPVDGTPASVLLPHSQAELLHRLAATSLLNPSA